MQAVVQEIPVLDPKVIRRWDKIASQRGEQIREDPVKWCKRYLGLSFWSKQREILEAVRDCNRVAVRSSNKGGKTFALAASVFWWLNVYGDGRVFTTSPRTASLKLQLWSALHQIRDSAPCRDYATTGQWGKDLGWSLTPTCSVVALNPEKPESWGGMHTAKPCYVIVDEASALQDSAMQAIQGLCAMDGSKIVLAGNPLSNEGPFARALKPGSGYRVVGFSAFDLPTMTGKEPDLPGLAGRQWIEEMRRVHGEDSPFWQARVMGVIPEDAAYGLIQPSWIVAAQQRQGQRGEKSLGVDVAYQGDDATVFQIIAGDIADKPMVHYGLEPMEVCGWVIRLMREFEIQPERVKIDAIGIGAGIVSRLHEQGWPVVGVNVAEQAADPDQFANRRTEAAWALREWIRTTACLPKDELLEGELAAVRLGKQNSRGQQTLELKTETKKRLGRSPDRFDALMLARYEPAPQYVERVVYANLVRDTNTKIGDWDD